MRSQIKGAEISFLCGVTWLCIRDWTSRGSLEKRRCYFRNKRSQLRWFGHPIKMPLERLLLAVFLVWPTWKRPKGRPRSHWRYYICDLAWECLGIPQEQLESVAGDRDVWITLLSLPPPQPDPGLAEENGWIDGLLGMKIWVVLIVDNLERAPYSAWHLLDITVWSLSKREGYFICLSLHLAFKWLLMVWMSSHANPA